MIFLMRITIYYAIQNVPTYNIFMKLGRVVSVELPLQKYDRQTDRLVNGQRKTNRSPMHHNGVREEARHS